MKILTIDVGSTNIKYALFDGDARVSDNKIPFPKPRNTANGAFEVDACEIKDIILDIAKRNSSGQIRISVQMHGYVADGTYISWRDRRVNESGKWQEIREKLASLVDAESGTALKPNSALSGIYLRYLNKEKIPSRFSSLGSYLAFALTGANCSHVTDLCATGFYYVDGTPNETAKLFDCAFATAVTDYKPIGKFAGAAVFPPIGDQQASIYAHADEKSYFLNIGTAAQLCAIVSGRAVGKFESRPFFGGTLCTLTGLIGGGAISEKGDCLSEKMQNEYMRALPLLPKRKKIKIMGGTAFYHKELILKALEPLGLPVEICAGDALDGLKLIKESE